VSTTLLQLGRWYSGDKAFAGSARIERIGDDGFMTALGSESSRHGASRTALVKGGDHLTVDGIMNRQKGSVNLTGHVNYPGIFRVSRTVCVCPAWSIP
jgi:hypothetical protein